MPFLFHAIMHPFDNSDQTVRVRVIHDDTIFHTLKIPFDKFVNFDGNCHDAACTVETKTRFDNNGLPYYTTDYSSDDAAFIHVTHKVSEDFFRVRFVSNDSLIWALKMSYEEFDLFNDSCHDAGMTFDTDLKFGVEGIPVYITTIR